MDSWAEGHFHTGRVPINSEAAVEFASSLLLPIEPELLRESLDGTEIFNGLEYLAMAKLSQPNDAIAFPTVLGMTVVIHSKGISVLFGPSEKCENCKKQEESKAIAFPAIVDPAEFDALMEMAANDKNH